MFALYDTIEKKYATVGFPRFSCQKDWVNDLNAKPVGQRAARLHKNRSTMKAQHTMLIGRLNQNVKMLDDGSWFAELLKAKETTLEDHYKIMIKWSEDCRRRLVAGHKNFGIEIVEV